MTLDAQLSKWTFDWFEENQRQPPPQFEDGTLNMNQKASMFTKAGTVVHKLVKNFKIK